MYATEFDVTRWLSSIPDLQNHPIPVSEPENDETDYGPPRKRQKLSKPQRGIPSPTISDSSSRKRRFDNLDDHHVSSAESDKPLDDTTSRPGRFLQSQQIVQTQQLGWIPYSVERGRDTPSATSRASSHSVATSGRSGRSKQDSASNRSSPSKQLRNAEMNDTGFTVGSFVLEPQPESLRKLRIELRDFGAGYGVCPASMKDEVCCVIISFLMPLVLLTLMILRCWQKIPSSPDMLLITPKPHAPRRVPCRLSTGSRTL